MEKHLINTFLKTALMFSALALPILAVPQAQADEKKTIYTGLACQPHDPQNITVDPATGTVTPSYSYFGSDIDNLQADPDPANYSFSDLGINCNIDRNLFGVNSKLKSVKVLLTDLSGPAADDGGYCHTHIEYFVPGSSFVDVIYGTDVYAADVPGSAPQVVTLPQSANAPSNTANYNIHCHVSGQWSSVTGYEVVEKN